MPTPRSRKASHTALAIAPLSPGLPHSPRPRSPSGFVVGQPITRKGSVCDSVRIGEVMDAFDDRLLVRRSLARSPDQALIFFRSQNDFFVNAQFSSQLRGVVYPQWLVDLVRIVEIR